LRKISQAGSFDAVRSPGPLRYAGLGIQLAVTVVVCVLVGQWADRKVGTDGVFTILAPLLGFGGTVYGLIRELARTDKDQQ
jgi:F0F1-type ATP synthase assembly protein I